MLSVYRNRIGGEKTKTLNAKKFNLGLMMIPNNGDEYKKTFEDHLEKEYSKSLGSQLFLQNKWK